MGSSDERVGEKEISSSNIVDGGESECVVCIGEECNREKDVDEEGRQILEIIENIGKNINNSLILGEEELGIEKADVENICLEIEELPEMVQLTEKNSKSKHIQHVEHIEETEHIQEMLPRA